MNYGMIKSILPKQKPLRTAGRTIISYRKVIDGILYVLKTGCQWKVLPKEYRSGSTCHRRFQEWNRLNVFKKIWIKGSVHLRKVYSLEMPYFICEFQKKNTLRIYWRWFIFLFFRSFFKKDSKQIIGLIYQKKSCFHLELDTKVQA